jgi:hypothetical protein
MIWVHANDRSNNNAMAKVDDRESVDANTNDYQRRDLGNGDKTGGTEPA